MKVLTTYKTAPSVNQKVRVKKQKPYEQGRLDGFCGIYCLVNTIHYLYGPISMDKAQMLLVEIIKHLNKHTDASDRIFDGTRTREIAIALNNVIEKKYQIHRRMPFRNRKVRVNPFWNHMQEFLDNNHGIILLGITDHWTLVKRVTDKSLILFDSDRMVRINKSSCTTNRNNPHNKLVLYSARTYYIWTD